MIYIIQVYTWYKKGLSFIPNRQRRKEGTLRASGVSGDRMVYTWYIHSKSICLAYTKNMTIQKLYIWYIPGIYQVEFDNILDLYLVYENIQEYTWYIPVVFQHKKNIHGIYLKYIWCIPIQKYIPVIYQGYTRQMTIWFI